MLHTDALLQGTERCKTCGHAKGSHGELLGCYFKGSQSVCLCKKFIPITPPSPRPAAPPSATQV